MVIAVLCVACVIGVAGNSIILIVLQCCKTKNPISILLINLAIANILFQIIVLPCQVAVYWFPYWTLGRIICRLSFITEDIASSQVSQIDIILILETDSGLQISLKIRTFIAIVKRSESKFFREKFRNEKLIVCAKRS